MSSVRSFVSIALFLGVPDGHHSVMSETLGTSSSMVGTTSFTKETGDYKKECTDHDLVKRSDRFVGASFETLKALAQSLCLTSESESLTPNSLDTSVVFPAKSRPSAKFWTSSSLIRLVKKKQAMRGKTATMVAARTCLNMTSS